MLEKNFFLEQIERRCMSRYNIWMSHLYKLIVRRRSPMIADGHWGVWRPRGCRVTILWRPRDRPNDRRRSPDDRLTIFRGRPRDRWRSYYHTTIAHRSRNDRQAITNDHVTITYNLKTIANDLNRSQTITKRSRNGHKTIANDHKTIANDRELSKSIAERFI